MGLFIFGLSQKWEFFHFLEVAKKAKIDDNLRHLITICIYYISIKCYPKPKKMPQIGAKLNCTFFNKVTSRLPKPTDSTMQHLRHFDTFFLPSIYVVGHISTEVAFHRVLDSGSIFVVNRQFEHHKHLRS